MNKYLIVVVTLLVSLSASAFKYQTLSGDDIIITGLGTTEVPENGVLFISYEQKSRNTGKIYHVIGIADGAFEGNTSIKSIDLPEGLETIGATAFKNCSKLEKAILPSSITEIGKSAFEGCFRLKEVKYPTGIVPERCFFDCIKLETFRSPVLYSIGDEAFSGCDNLNPINKTPSTYIGYEALPEHLLEATHVETLTLNTDKGIIMNGLIVKNGKKYLKY